MPEQKQILLSMKAAGAAMKDIAAAVGKSIGACYQMVHALRHQPQDDGWPVAEKCDKTPAHEAPVANQGEGPKMKFKTVKARNTWGHESEMQVPVPTGKYKDPETGAKVTTYPPGYAYGAGPQKNVSVKGGS